MAQNSASRKPNRCALITGRLLEHGHDTDRHQAGVAPSYFVKLKTARTERTLWGVDLERALKESLTQPALSEEVGLHVVRNEPVTVKVPQRLSLRGCTQRAHEFTTYRDRWIIEKRGFFDDRAIAASIVRNAIIDAKEALRNHPELASIYRHLKRAQKVAALRIRDPEDQRNFIAMVRTTLADLVARGERLAPAQGPKMRGGTTRRASPWRPVRETESPR